jgi:hypothetical protein
MQHMVPVISLSISGYKLIAIALLVLLLPITASAWHDPGPTGLSNANNAMVVTDGSYVMDIGQLQMNITNNGLIGSQYSIVSSYSDAPSGQWPGGSGIEYLFSAGLWIGGIRDGAAHVSTGQYERELWPLTGPEHTIYEARFGKSIRPNFNDDRTGARIFEPEGDDDRDGRYNEDMLNGLDDDGDGLIDEDFEMQGNQMMVCTMYDNTPMSKEMYPDHYPLDLKIEQTAFAWEMEDVDDFVVFSYKIRNIGTTDIDDMYVGMQVDCDIGMRDGGGSGAFNDRAGIFQGMARTTNGMYESVEVAYMYDGEGKYHVDGYFGVMFRGSHSMLHRIHSYNLYTGTKPYEMGGSPTNDAERYNELSEYNIDENTEDEEQGDYHFLISNGNKGSLRPGQSTRVEVVFVCGGNFEELLENCANAHQAWEGAWYDMDNDTSTGTNGRESFMCIEDYGLTIEMFKASPFVGMVAMAADVSCRYPLPETYNIRPDDLDLQLDGRHCIWVNMDNCDECANLRGKPCTRGTFWGIWNCSRWWLSLDERRGCTGIGGRETVFRWITESIPPPPDMRLWSEDSKVHIVWNDDSESERDLVTDHMDFEGYMIYRADDWDRPFGTSEVTGPPEESWRILDSFDLVNEAIISRDIANVTQRDTVSLGFNTGLEEIRHEPSCLSDPRFEGLAERMAQVVATGKYVDPHYRPSIRMLDGSVRADMTDLLPWEDFPAVLDTFYWVTPYISNAMGTPNKPAKKFYEYIDEEIHNGFLYFYGVVTTDHDMAIINNRLILTGPGLQGDPTTNFSWIRPGSNSQTANDVAADGSRIYVYPNPATREALSEFQQMYPNSKDPTGVRVMFTNLPAAHNTINIFTLDGDLVASLDHDGTDGYGDVSWNLVTRNGQQAVSGIYLYSVISDNDRFPEFIDKFVLIR